MESPARGNSEWGNKGKERLQRGWKKSSGQLIRAVSKRAGRDGWCTPATQHLTDENKKEKVRGKPGRQTFQVSLGNIQSFPKGTPPKICKQKA